MLIHILTYLQYYSSIIGNNYEGYLQSMQFVNYQHEIKASLLSIILTFRKYMQKLKTP